MLKERYVAKLKELLEDESINNANRRIWKQFFQEQEIRLKRRNDLSELDDGCYKTLYGYITKFRIVNGWFKNKAWINLEKSDIQRVYNDLEDGKILNQMGKKYKDRRSFYNKIFRSRPFALAKKDGIARDVLTLGIGKEDNEVRFIKEEAFRKLVEVAVSPSHKCLLWLAWDIGENISSLLRLEKRDFTTEIEKDTARPYYRINLRKEILKRSRRDRGITTNYKETYDYLEIILRDLKHGDKLFKFAYRNAVNILDRAVDITKVKCIPKNDAITWKDLRSSMACHLLSIGWSRDEVNARLGHTPSSREIDKYVNFLALDDKKPRQIFQQDMLSKVKLELEQAQRRESLYNARVDNLVTLNEEMKKQMELQQTKLNVFVEELMNANKREKKAYSIEAQKKKAISVIEHLMSSKEGEMIIQKIISKNRKSKEMKKKVQMIS